jgi:predicted lipoprotein with Yx(FWY)xxD motif
MRRTATVLVAGLLVLAGCGDDDEGSGSSYGSDDAPATESAPGETMAPAETTAPEKPAAPKRKGTTIKLGDSEFGTMLFDTNDQAIYIFENDPKGETVCYDECAEAWPPVYTDGEPEAADGVKQSLLGTIKRRDGRLQVTYAGKPLYFYDHEGPGEVRCHNVNLNGGLWWVVGPDGKRRP